MPSLSAMDSQLRTALKNGGCTLLAKGGKPFRGASVLHAPEGTLFVRLGREGKVVPLRFETKKPGDPPDFVPDSTVWVTLGKALQERAFSDPITAAMSVREALAGA